MTTHARRLGGVRSDETVVRLIPYGMLAALVIWLAVLEPASFTVDATTRIVDISVVLILVGIGQTIVMLTGGIDLSVGGADLARHRDRRDADGERGRGLARHRAARAARLGPRRCSTGC